MKNLYNFIILICVIVLCSTNLFAENINRTVYGVLSETYSGVATDGTGGVDNVTYTNVNYNYSDFVEGEKSIEIIAEQKLEVTFNTSQYIKDYLNGYLYFSAKIPSMTFGANDYFEIITNKSHKVVFSSTGIERLDGSGNLVADNTWHTYRIQGSVFTNQLNQPASLLFGVNSKSGNPTILIDNVYWTKNNTASRTFNATIKNVSDNVETSSITWNQSCFGKSWKASDQYVELNLDYESINWHIKTYLRNGNASRVGLYYEDTEGTDHILPMAWRISADTLPNSSGDTLQIGVSTDNGLYDIGKYPSGTDKYAWCRMREENGGTDFNDTTVWNLRGIHTAIGDTDVWSSLGNYYEKAPKLYFAADCSTSHLSTMYTATIVFELYYE